MSSRAVYMLLRAWAMLLSSIALFILYVSMKITSCTTCLVLSSEASTIGTALQAPIALIMWYCGIFAWLLSSWWACTVCLEGALTYCIDDVVAFHLEGVHSMYGRSTHILHMIGKFQSVASAKPCTDWPIFPTPERQSSWRSPLERKETAVSWRVVPTK